jgi:hypothetical protein
MSPLDQEGNSSLKQADRRANAIAIASKLHYDKGIDASAVRNMSFEQFKAISGREDIDPYETSQVMRAYEHYK